MSNMSHNVKITFFSIIAPKAKSTDESNYTEIYKVKFILVNRFLFKYLCFV